MNITSTHHPIGLSIKGKLLLFILSVSLIPITIITMLYYISARNIIKQQKLNDLLAIAESKRIHILAFLEAKTVRTLDFSTDGFIKEELVTISYGRKHEAIVNLNKHLSADKKTIDPSIVAIIVLDKDGKAVASTNEILIGLDMSNQEIFTQIIDKGYGEVFTGQPRFSPELDMNVIFVSAPLVSRVNGEIIGAIINVYHSVVLTSMVAENVRTVDFSTDGFIRDSLDTINREDLLTRDEAVIALNNHLLINKKPLDPHIKFIEVVDRHGKVVASTNEITIGKTVASRVAFAKVMDKTYGEHYITQPHYNPFLNTKGLDVDIYAPIIFSGSVEPLGILINHYDMSVLNTITTDLIGLGETGKVYLINRDGEMLTESRFIEDASLMQIVDTRPVRKILESDTAMPGIYSDYRGISVVGASMYLPECGWILLVEVDEEEVFAPLKMLGIIALAVGLSCAAVVVGLSIVFAISMSRPIRKLTHATERLAGGNLEYEIEIPRNDEIGILASSFNRMRIQFGKLLKNIEEGKKDWESTFDSVRDIITLWDKDDRLIRYNKALLKNLDVKSGDIIGKNCHEIFPHIKVECLSECQVKEITKTLDTVTRELDVPCFGGIFSISNFPRFDDNGEFVGTVRVMRDITGRKQAEEKLKLYSYQQEQIANIGLRALIGTDLLTLMNEIVNIVSNTLDMEFCKILELLPDGQTLLLRAGIGWKKGYVGHATVGTDYDSQAGYTLLSNKPIIVEDIRTETRFRGTQLLNDHSVISGVSVIIQGTKRPFGVLGVHATKRLTFSKDDINFIQSITNVLAEAIERKADIERKREEEVIREIAAIVEYSDDAILGVTPEGIITSWNPGAKKVYGYTADEMIGKHINILILSNRPDKSSGILERVIHGGRIEHLENTCVTKDGNENNISMTISPIKNPDGKIIGASAIARNITKTKELERKLKISYKMSSLGRLAAGVFHEVLNPLNIISSYTQLLLVQKKWGPNTEKDLKKVLEEVSRIVKITDGLLGFARRKEYNLENVELNNLLQKVIDIIEPEMKLENIELLKRFNKELPMIKANKDELRQVFLNLIHNANSAMPNGGKLTISTQNIKKQGKLFTRISFTDTGCGIPKKHIDEIFDPFFSTKEEGAGTGLGLNISYGIISKHGGDLSVNSKEGKGSIFKVDLPVET